MDKNCAQCKTKFQITEADEKFYKKMDVSSPSLCPKCRMIRRLSYRNDRSLYHSKSSLSGKEMISMYDPANNFPVYEQKEWWSDDWDPLTYGRVYDETRDFFSQYRDLKHAVPHFNVFNRDTENCDFVNYGPHCKNCYLTFGSWFNENCIYGQTLNECKDCIDNLFLSKSELCYENVDCLSNYNSFFCQNSNNCTDSFFCYDCKNLSHCIGCYNLRNKEYHVLNKPVSKEQYESIKKNFSSHAFLMNFKKNYKEELRKNAIHRCLTGINNENVSGDFIFNCKNAHHCFSAYDGQDIAYSARIFNGKDCYDFEGGGKSELTYENMSNDFSYKSIGCTTCENLIEAHYCDLCFNCEKCFGCVGLRRKKFCILNKQYTEAEYESLVLKIINKMKKDKEWGEFPPIQHSPFAYNETLAQEYFPLTKTETVQKGFRWKDEESQNKYHGPIIVLTDTITDVDSSISKQILTCNDCKKNYKIIEQELEFLKKFGIAAPRLCPNCRHKNRMQLRTPRALWSRKCDKCKSDMQTAYAPERPEKVYCEECYLKTVY